MDKQAQPTQNETPAASAVRLVRTGLKASLATLDGGHPYASLVLVATEPDGSPLLLISKLAQHTRNLEADPRASLLFDGTDAAEDPLSGARVSVRGTVEITREPRALRRFLARHPSAEGYAAFPDFATYRMQMQAAHFVGGFGRIVGLARQDLVLPLEGASALLEAEPEIVAHMNADHADAVSLYATRLYGAAAGAWRLTGVDPEGFDLVCGTRALRAAFPERVTSPAAAREAFVAMVRQARASAR